MTDRGIEWETDAVSYLQLKGYYILDQYDRLKGNPDALKSFESLVERRVRDRIEDVFSRAR